MKETRTLEFKETVTNTFLKTVSAYANYGTGEIRFGIADDGTVKGISEPKKACLDIENRINDSIDPNPEYTLHINENTSVITLTVYEGIHKPYLYKAKAYRRNDTSTIAVDRTELTRLILEGENLSFEELPAAKQTLTFHKLQKAFMDVMHLDSFSKDTIKTLELYTDDKGYNNAAELLADTNGFAGIDIVRFGSSMNIILDRETHEHESVINQFDNTITMYRKYYQYDRITGSARETISQIPEEAFREAVANAIVHRTWDVNVNTHISMFTDRIEVVSPGGLPKGMTETEYLRGGISVLRNRIIANVFLRLHMIEKFGTGIRRIHEAYKSSEIKPVFEITENTIRVVLPVMSCGETLTNDENTVYRLVKGRSVPSSSIVEETGFGKTKTVSILKKLVENGYIKTTGNGRGLRYTAD